MGCGPSSGDAGSKTRKYASRGLGQSEFDEDGNEIKNPLQRKINELQQQLDEVQNEKAGQQSIVEEPDPGVLSSWPPIAGSAQRNILQALRHLRDVTSAGYKYPSDPDVLSAELDDKGKLKWIDDKSHPPHLRKLPTPEMTSEMRALCGEANSEPHKAVNALYDAVAGMGIAEPEDQMISRIAKAAEDAAVQEGLEQEKVDKVHAVALEIAEKAVADSLSTDQIVKMATAAAVEEGIPANVIVQLSTLMEPPKGDDVMGFNELELFLQILDLKFKGEIFQGLYNQYDKVMMEAKEAGDTTACHHWRLDRDKMHTNFVEPQTVPIFFDKIRYYKELCLPCAASCKAKCDAVEKKAVENVKKKLEKKLKKENEKRAKRGEAPLESLGPTKPRKREYHSDHAPDRTATVSREQFFRFVTGQLMQMPGDWRFTADKFAWDWKRKPKEAKGEAEGQVKGEAKDGSGAAGV